MTNVFERARAIRMNGEPWQNAVQRAGSQIRYENQVGGRKTRSDKGKKRGPRDTPTKTLATGRKVAHRNDAAENCLWHAKTGRCHVSAQGKRTPEHQRSVEKFRATMARKYPLSSLSPGRRGQKTTKGQPYSPGSDKQISQRQRFGAKSAARRSKKAAASQSGGRRERSDKGKKRGKRTTPTKTLATGRKVAHRNDAAENCVWHAKTGRCHVSAHGKRISPDKRQPAKLSPAAQAQREAFTRAAQSVAKGKGSSKARRDAVRAATKGKGKFTGAARQTAGAWDGYSNTSSTRSSDFTSVSDTTSYSQNGGSWTSRDSSSLW